ncbi:MAG: hypothetical protein JJ892_05965 [Balneola sp.]|nr:hypothetical protein [Balneola sp.]MBO6650038.1 hypothetical protein [Balneola sp.]MBO6711612.1 hypothetical protein [Balneola sp.]MBO6799808.1 hypothetical protein [Balneola sp.]MBO6870751.1 hypothetical protein [Balneola sp.]
MGALEISVIVFVLTGFTVGASYRLLKLFGSNIYLRIKLKELNWRYIRKVKPDPFEEVQFTPMIYGAQAGEIQFNPQNFSNHFKIEVEQNNKRYHVWIRITVSQMFTTLEHLEKTLVN